ncbi:hypothetical protein QJS10_CPA05g01554 [Acorus calamus]|uniref:Protein root UVB sensitive/RUS domain-containing protein n=1 Tax=Acorus calamus TaxID=4465 RepID=A0AAV9EUL1_ACOCL|nr:hypothetical protein QJS10_CPA05g01554 [Acorus calamus]
MRHTLCSEPYAPLQVPWMDRKPLKPQPRRRIRINPRIRFRSKDIDGEESETPLPIAVIRRSGGVSRYVCNGGARLRLVEVDRGEADELGSDGGFRSFLRMSKSAVRELFVPRRVGDNYMGYVKWKLLHRVFSSALQVLATQAMFRAIGIGSSQSLSSAAALNWLLKDGLGRLSRCIYTASVESAFDTNLKRVRFSTSILFSLSIGIELMTPAFPQYFLLLATIANIAKSISLAAYIVTGSAIHRSFAVADNLGEVSAKSQVQTVCFDNVGLMLAALMNMLCKNNQRLRATLPLFIYPIFSTIDLFSIYQGLKHVHLQTLTKDRLEILDTWIHSGCIPSPAVGSNKEGFGLLRRQDSKTWLSELGSLTLKSHHQRF